MQNMPNAHVNISTLVKEWLKSWEFGCGQKRRCWGVLTARDEG